MKITINKKILLEALNYANNVINNKNTLPILDYILVDAKKKEALITGTDLETTVTVTIPVESDKEGLFLLDPRTIIPLCGKLNDEEITFEVKDSVITINTVFDNFEFTNSGKPKDFPVTVIVEGKGTISSKMNSIELRDILKVCGSCTATDELRPVMCGVFVEAIADKKVHFVASDAHKLAHIITEAPTKSTKLNFVLPNNAVRLLSKIKKEEVVEYSYNEKNALFTFDNLTIACRLVEGNYPNYGSVIPKESIMDVVVNTSSLRLALEKTLLVANDSSALIKFEITEDEITVTGEDIDYSRHGNVKIECTHLKDEKEMVVGFKGPFLLDIINAIKDEYTIIKLQEPTRAGLFYGYDNEKKEENLDIELLLMPMMINV